VHGVAAAAVEYDPTAHGAQPELPSPSPCPLLSPLYPAAHTLHAVIAVLAVFLSSADVVYPIAQSLHVPAPAPDLYLPTSHAEQPVFVPLALPEAEK